MGFKIVYTCIHTNIQWVQGKLTVAVLRFILGLQIYFFGHEIIVLFSKTCLLYQNPGSAGLTTQM